MGFGFRRPKIRIRGTDVAGTVEVAGKSVTQLKQGDSVYGTCDGSFAEYACAKAERFAPKPVNLSFEQAAAVPVSGMTALNGLRDAGKLQPGQRVLVIGAAGGEGGDRWLGGFQRQIFAPVRSLFTGQKLLGLISKERHKDLLTLKELIEAGKLTPVIDRTYPLSEAREAIGYLERGHARGKVVLTVSD